jgi:hypothetical protein
MTVTRGPKGKYFTEVIRKKPFQARIQTSKELIEGTIHVHPERRPLDEINEVGSFLAVTQATIYATEGELEADFIAVNVDQIVWLQPLQEAGDFDE